MNYILISIITLIGAALILFSGFGLGTLLMPVFALFFPIEIAISLTAIVHFANNLIKLVLFKKYINWNIALRFGLPSIITAFIGAWLLSALLNYHSIYSYSINNTIFHITIIKLIIAVLLIIFALIDLIPKLSKIDFDKKYLPLGGLLSGFFGGLSGNQGALRAAFLIKSGLSKEAYIATGVIIACMVDITRLSIYSKTILLHINLTQIYILSTAIISAFIGVYFGNKLVKKVTINTLQIIVAIFLLTFSVLLGLGII